MRKVKPFIHILSNFHEFLSNPTPSAAAVNWSGSEARFEETQDQLSPRHFENTGSNSFFYVECSYLVNIQPNHSRICWYKKIYSLKYFSPTYVSVSEGGVFQSFSRQRFLTLTFNPLVPNPIYTWRNIMIFTMWVCYLKVGTKPKQFFRNSIFYVFYACIIYDTLVLVEFLFLQFTPIPLVYLQIEKNDKTPLFNVHRMKYEHFQRGGPGV